MASFFLILLFINSFQFHLYNHEYKHYICFFFKEIQIDSGRIVVERKIDVIKRDDDDDDDEKRKSDSKKKQSNEPSFICCMFSFLFFISFHFKMYF